MRQQSFNTQHNPLESFEENHRARLVRILFLASIAALGAGLLWPYPSLAIAICLTIASLLCWRKFSRSVPGYCRIAVGTLVTVKELAPPHQKDEEGARKVIVQYKQRMFEAELSTKNEGQAVDFPGEAVVVSQLPGRLLVSYPADESGN